MIDWPSDEAIRGPYPVSPVCSRCRHFQVVGAMHRRCTAFPDGIPVIIWNGLNDHTTPFPGDGGTRFEPLTDEDRERNRLALERVVKERNERMRRNVEGARRRHGGE